MENKMIDIDKKYTTRAGKEVRIYKIDSDGEYPVDGAVLERGFYFQN